MIIRTAARLLILLQINIKYSLKKECYAVYWGTDVVLNWRGISYCVLVIGGFHVFSIKLVNLLIVLQHRKLNTETEHKTSLDGFEIIIQADLI